MNYTVKLKSGDCSHTTLSNYATTKGKFQEIFLLLHGFPDNNTSFKELGAILNNRYPKALILAPLMRGYEPSSYHAFSEYRTSDLALDIHNWVTQLGNGPVTLIGHDWGAIACFKAASLYPDDIKLIITLAIPYLSNLHLHDLIFHVPQQFWYSSYFLTMQSSWLYSKLTAIGSSSYLNNIWKYWSPTWDFDHDDIESVRKTLSTEETVDHVTAYYRCLLNPLNITNARWHIDFSKVPTYLIGGNQDQCMSVRLYELEQNRLHGVKNTKVDIIHGVGHFLHRENPHKVGKLVIDWVDSH